MTSEEYDSSCSSFQNYCKCASESWHNKRSISIIFTNYYKIESMLCNLHRMEPFVQILIMLNTSMRNTYIMRYRNSELYSPI